MNSQLRRLEEFALAPSAVRALELPKSIEFIHPCALLSVEYLAIEPGNRHFMVEDFMLFDRERRAVLGRLNHQGKVVVPRSIERLGDSCCAWRSSVSEIHFEKVCSLSRIEDCAFWKTTI
jgi:hypothetical protein